MTTIRLSATIPFSNDDGIDPKVLRHNVYEALEDAMLDRKFEGDTTARFDEGEWYAQATVIAPYLDTPDSPPIEDYTKALQDITADDPYDWSYYPVALEMMDKYPQVAAQIIAWAMKRCLPYVTPKPPFRPTERWGNTFQFFTPAPEDPYDGEAPTVLELIRIKPFVERHLADLPDGQYLSYDFDVGIDWGSSDRPPDTADTYGIFRSWRSACRRWWKLHLTYPNAIDVSCDLVIYTLDAKLQYIETLASYSMLSRFEGVITTDLGAYHRRQLQEG